MQDLETLMSKQVDQLHQHGKLTRTVLAQMYHSVSNKLNGDPTNSQEQSAKKKVQLIMKVKTHIAVTGGCSLFGHKCS